MKYRNFCAIALFSIIGSGCTNTSINEVMYLKADFDNQSASTSPTDLTGDPVGDSIETSNAQYFIRSGSTVSGSGKALEFGYPNSSPDQDNYIDLVLAELDNETKVVIVEMKLAKNFFFNPSSETYEAQNCNIHFLLDNDNPITKIRLDGRDGSVVVLPSRNLGQLNQGAVGSVEATVLRLIIDMENENFRAGINNSAFGTPISFDSPSTCQGSSDICYKLDRIRFSYESGSLFSGKLILDDVTVRSYATSETP